MQMSARIVRDPRGLLVRVSGDLGLATAPALDAVLQTATRLVAGGGAGLRVDLRHLRLVDRAGLVPLRTAQARLRADGRRLRLTAVPAPVFRLLALLPDRQLLDAASCA